jgi:hypothetical protein
MKKTFDTGKPSNPPGLKQKLGKLLEFFKNVIIYFIFEDPKKLFKDDITLTTPHNLFKLSR